MLCVAGGARVRTTPHELTPVRLHLSAAVRLVHSNARITQHKEFLRQFGKGSVHLEYNKHVATVTIANPEKRNALSGKMMAELGDIVDQLAANTNVSCVILQGAEGTFCSGADLSVARDHLNTPEAGTHMCEYMQNILTKFFQLPCVTVAAIEGRAMGGGAELTTACDHRIMAQDASVHFVQARMGVTPGWGGGIRLLKILGRQRALRLLAGSIPMSAQMALEWQYADALCESRQTHAHAMLFLEPYLQNPVETVRAAKRVIAGADVHTFEHALEEEKKIFASLWGKPANQQAVSQKGMKRANNSSSASNTGSDGTTNNKR